MKFPKLKHTVLCQLLLYAPTFIFFLWFIALAVIPGTWKESTLLGIGTFLLTAGFTLWYLLHNFLLLLTSDQFFGTVRQWKKDRAEYRTDRNGLGVDQIRKTLLRRCRRWGRRFLPQSGGSENMEVFYRSSYSWTVFWSSIEKKAAVCTADTLCAEQYRALMAQARSMFSKIPRGKIRFKTKSERKAPCAEAGIVLILADTVEEEVRQLARKPLLKEEKFCILPCVIQCCDGSYYTACTAEYYEQGLVARPAGNFAAAMIRKLVFRRHLPQENRQSQPKYALVYDLNMSLWEYIGMFRREMREADDAEKKERGRVFRRMHDEQVRVGDGVVWYKHENMLAEYGILPDEADEKLVTVVSDPIWYYQKSGNFFRRNDLNRKRMKKEEKEIVQRSMEAGLSAAGYRISGDGI